jgi:hypothetical protein
MEILAGAFSGSAKTPIPPSLEDELRRGVSRRQEDTRHVLERGGFFVVGVGDPSRRGAFGEKPDGSVHVVLGDPLDDVTSGSVAALEGMPGPMQWLLSATGTFCGLTFEAGSRRLWLFTDKLGVRPLYFARAGSDLVVFASALRILEGITIDRTLDLRGVLEMAAFSFPLGRRTAFVEIEAMAASELTLIEGPAITRRRYWRWDRIGPSADSLDDLARGAHEAFDTAIDRRLRSRPGDQFAFLSGGLDSRCVVAGLRSHGAAVTTVNVGFPDSADRVFGALVAEKLGTTHREVEFPRRARVRWGAIAAEAIGRTAGDEGWSEMWSGDGGSVGVGHAYLSPRVVGLMRAGSLGEAAGTFLREWSHHLAARVLARPLRQPASHVLQDGIVAELGKHRCEDPGKAFYLFLMQNDQRRHLAAFYDDNDLHRVDYVLPFYDSGFVERIMSVPMDECLRHRFYYRWLKEFPEPVWNTPWQAYRNHEPCPVPFTGKALTQWDAAWLESWKRDEALAGLKAALRAERFPRQLLSRPSLLLLYLFQLAGGRGYEYVSDVVTTLLEHWRLSNHSVAWRALGDES